MIAINSTSRPRLAIPAFSPDQMREIGEFARGQEVRRISQGININDVPARSLWPPYARQKSQSGAQPVRDLRLTGSMLESRRVVESQLNEVTVSFSDARQTIKARRNEGIEPMLGISQGTRPAIDSFIAEEFAVSVRAVK